ncbi:hypothetical protein ACSBR1_031903 [Camellia fascicularis]
MELSLRSSSLSSRGLCLRSLNLKGSCPSSAELPLPATLGTLGCDFGSSQC